MFGFVTSFPEYIYTLAEVLFQFLYDIFFGLFGGARIFFLIDNLWGVAWIIICRYSRWSHSICRWCLNDFWLEAQKNDKE